MILGVGIDLTPIDRMQAALARHAGRLEAKLFTDGERRFCAARAQPSQHFAARFAAKEAAVKAVAALRGQPWHSVEVKSDDAGAPRIELHEPALSAARGAGVRRLHLSLSHAAGQAVAVVVAED